MNCYRSKPVNIAYSLRNKKIKVTIIYWSLLVALLIWLLVLHAFTTVGSLVFALGRTRFLCVSLCLLIALEFFTEKKPIQKPTNETKKKLLATSCALSLKETATWAGTECVCFTLYSLKSRTSQNTIFAKLFQLWIGPTNKHFPPCCVPVTSQMLLEELSKRQLGKMILSISAGIGLETTKTAGCCGSPVLSLFQNLCFTKKG